ncbi:class I SAM-dependent methyltransferase [Nocardioides insulae]|uniref:class I SAM-dependent methyltransferase n=1 Tax=Nocardioides insulae TaxID=394734 RepID=UPI0003FEABE2|nr:class I SAM-dependent methyltransferase [Nocardioides insulae]
MAEPTVDPEEQIRRAIDVGVAPPFARLIGGIPGPLSIRQGDLLRELAARVTQGVIVEIGSYRGKSTVALAHGAREGHDVPVYAVDPHESFNGPFGGVFGPVNRRQFYETMLSTGHWENVRLVNLPSTVVAAGWDRPIGLLWIDGDHHYEAVRADVESWERHLLPGAPMVLDDTDRGGPQQVVAELVDSGRWRLGEKRRKVQVLHRVG